MKNFLQTILLLTLSWPAPAQTPEQLLEKSRRLLEADRYGEALAAAEAALIRLEALPPGIPRDTLQITGLCRAGDGMLGLARYPEALKYFQAALHSGKERKYPLWQALALHKLGNYYSSQGNSRAAVEYFREALRLRTSALGDRHPLVADTYHNIGNCYLENTDYAAALEQHKQALRIREAFYPRSHPAIGDSHINIGNCFYGLNDVEQALRHYRQAAQILETVPSNNHLATRAGLLDNMGNCYTALGDYGQAESAYRAACRQFQRIYGEQHPETAMALNNLGNLFWTKKKFSAALACHRQALAIRQKVWGEVHPDVGASWVNIASCQLELSQADTALFTVERALGAYHFDPLNSSSAVSGGVLTALYVKATIYESMSRDRPQQRIYLLNESLQCYRQILPVLDRMRLSYFEMASKEQLAATARYYMEKSIALCCALVRAGQGEFAGAAFDFFEKSRALILMDAVARSRATVFSQAPALLVQEEKELSARVAAAERQLNRLEINSNSTDIDTLRQHIFDLKEAYRNVMERLKNSGERYYNLFYNSATAGIGTVQNMLDADRAIVLYFTGQEHCYAMVVRKDSVFLRQLDAQTGQLTALVADLNHSLSQRPANAQTTGMYSRPAYALFEQLILPVKPFLRSRLTIVPDGALGYLSFDVLLTAPAGKTGERPDFKNRFAYLLFEYDISYCYSVSLLREMAEPRGKKTVKQLLAIAPEFDSRDREEGLSPLFLNTGEAKMVRNAIGSGDLLLGRAARKDTLLELMPGYRILHFSTHGEADDWEGQQSFLALSANDRAEPGNRHLYAADLYGLSLKADLVVLSACETAAGEIREGEGIISLARGFAYAGAGSLVTTLWQVQEHSTGEILRFFYSNLKAGLPKDEALWLAKKSFLQAVADPAAAHPSCWGSLIPIGDMSPVFPQRSFWATVFIVLAGLGIAGFLAWKWLKGRKIYL